MRHVYLKVFSKGWFQYSISKRVTLLSCKKRNMTELPILYEKKNTMMYYWISRCDDGNVYKSSVQDVWSIVWFQECIRLVCEVYIGTVESFEPLKHEYNSANTLPSIIFKTIKDLKG